MKFNASKTLLVCVLLSGCAQTQIPYKISKVVEHKSRLMPAQFPLGITQEKLAEKEYRITAKLADFGTNKRARSMALYHASILAEKQGYDAFIVNKFWNASWCGSSRNVKTNMIGSVNGGPTAKLIITLAVAEKSGKRKKLRLTKETKDSNKALIDYVPTEIELDQISTERLELCAGKARKRIVRR
ncbi:MAG: hypothetical protein ACI9YH_000027 [Colwellia sp.]|jgi:hypothetical protein